VQKYKVLDSVTVTRHYVDSLRSNVIVLVESWGIPRDDSRFTEELQIFDGVVQQLGVHSRMYSRTRTAEREDWIFGFIRDSMTQTKDTTFLPQEFAKKGFKTSFFLAATVRNSGVTSTFIIFSKRLILAGSIRTQDRSQ
jgi:hypothetical protein